MTDFIKRLRNAIKRFILPFSAARYWERRYAKGRTSGSGSYGKHAQTKAQFINAFVAQNGITSVMEFGCGDGNQLSHAIYPAYTGFDISRTAVQNCRQKFAADPSKTFALLDDYQGETADLALSLDVIFHLVEDASYKKHLHRLFDSAIRFAVIHAPDTDQNDWGHATHCKNHLFTTWIKKNKPTWTLIQHHKTATGGEFYVFARQTV